MTATVFIDGEQGTTGLQIHARLAGRKDVSLLSLPYEDRRDVDKRRAMLNRADIVILCLPDDAAVESVSMIENPDVRVIDASTAHRTAEGWVFGFPEYDAGQRQRVAEATRVSNPGCYAVASISLLHPLVGAGILPADWPVTINAVSGYSGGGKGMIAEFEDETSPSYTEAPFFVYGLTLKHKHVPEIQRHSGLAHRPIFMPSVGRFAQGMIVQVPLQLWALPGAPTPAKVHETLADHYAGCRYVSVASPDDVAAIGRLEPELVNGTNELRLHVFGNEAEGQVVLMALLDNLGKGASGSTVQNMNIMLGMDEGAGLDG
ncbi:MAG: N-acetyl-gamma-glutamyl-phosphate reductase [Gammaproteobacteria bacterium]|jgi:N-acetyl-gamma-glutamyl-phosphate reductase